VSFLPGLETRQKKVLTVMKHLEQSERYRSVSGVFVFTATASQRGERQRTSWYLG
jgi:hypothetical protein